MIDPKAVVTYAQYNEDVILAALLHDTENGFYVDVGASYPETDSVTKFFYDQGWKGINIEPIKHVHTMLKKSRPRDINIQCGIGQKAGSAKFREYEDKSGHSTFQTNQKQQHAKDIKYKDYDVEIRTLDNVLDDYNVQNIHFLKVDVEGFEYEVIAGNNWKKYRPEVVCIEANHISQDWANLLKAAKYELFIMDGLNKYYLRRESFHRTEGFVERVVTLDYHALKQHQAQSWKEDSKMLVQLHELVARQDAEIKRLQQEVSTLHELSFSDKTLPARIKLTGRGLTHDWIKYKRKKTRKHH